MPSLKPTKITGHITWLGYTPHRDEPRLETHPVTEMPLDFAGFDKDCHAGLTRSSCSRVTSQHAKGTEIRNVRQLSLVSAEENAEIAKGLGLDALDPAWVGASVVISGIPDFSHLPPSSRLQTEDGTTLIVDMENRPCQFPAMTIAAAKPGYGKDYKAVATGKRGVLACVERPGVLRIGDVVRLHVPDQRAWAPQMDLFED